MLAFTQAIHSHVLVVKQKCPVMDSRRLLRSTIWLCETLTLQIPHIMLKNITQRMNIHQPCSDVKLSTAVVGIDVHVAIVASEAFCDFKVDSIATTPLASVPTASSSLSHASTQCRTLWRPHVSRAHVLDSFHARYLCGLSRKQRIRADLWLLGRSEMLQLHSLQPAHRPHFCSASQV